MVPLLTVLVTLSNQSGKKGELDQVPTLIEKLLKQPVAVIVAVTHGSTQVNVAVVIADHTVGVTSPIDAQTAMVQTAAFVNTLEAENVSMLPDKVISVVHGPAGVTIIQ